MPSLPLLERRLTTATYRGLAILDLGCGSAAAGVLLAQTISGCQAVVAEVGGPGRLAKLNLRASIPATRSCLTLANMPPETVLLRERMARQLDIIIMTRQGLQENRFWFVMNTAKLLTAHYPRALVLLACKADVETQKNLTETFETEGFQETGNTTVPTPLDESCVPSLGIRITEFIRQPSQTLEGAV